MTAWEVAGEYVYTTPGDQDTDYLMLTLSVPGYRWRQTCLLKDITLKAYICIDYLPVLNKLVSTGCLSLWPLTARGVNCLASPSSLRPSVQPTANFSSWRWEEMFNVYSHVLLQDVSIWRSTAWRQYEHIWSECICLQGYNQWNNDVVEQWRGTSRKQSYSYLVQSNSTTSFTWTFQRTEDFNMVRHNHSPWISLLISDPPTASLPQP